MPVSKSDVPPTGPAVAGHASRVIGGTSRVFAYGDDNESQVTFLMTSEGAPESGWATHSSVTLHTTANVMEGTDIRVELLVVGVQSDALLANVISTAAFYVIKNRWLAAPGVVFPNVVAEYYPASTTPHLLWVEPITYPTLGAVEIEGAGSVHWLQGVPITEPERALLHSEGMPALDARLDGKPVERIDLQRESYA